MKEAIKLLLQKMGDVTNTKTAELLYITLYLSLKLQ